MKFYDLFCGIGGFRLGLERSGFECVGSCEIDKYAREIYKKNFGDYPTERDIREVDYSKLPDLDILTAGFPCQSFSIAGKRMGFDDTRGTLFFEIIRIAAKKRPEILFLENVKGLLNHDRGRTFGTIINTIYELGYDVEWQVINGKYFVPQNRERVFIIGHLRGKPFRKIFPIIESISWSDESQKKATGKESWFWYSNCIDASYKKAAGSRPHVLMDDGRLRIFTLLEVERLMGFPDNYTQLEEISDTQRYKMLGNSVIPQIIEMIGRKLCS